MSNTTRDHAQPSGLDVMAPDGGEAAWSALKEAQRLTARVNKIFGVSLEELPSTIRRPHRSMPMRMLMAVPLLRGLVPKTVGQLIAEILALGPPPPHSTESTSLLARLKGKFGSDGKPPSPLRQAMIDAFKQTEQRLGAR